MKIRTILLMAAAAIGGIYLTSEEGTSTRKNLLNKKSAIEPVVKNLLKNAGEILEGTKKINSEEIRTNVQTIVDEAKKILLELDLEKAAATIKEAIKVASSKLNDASNVVIEQKWREVSENEHN